MRDEVPDMQSEAGYFMSFFNFRISLRESAIEAKWPTPSALVIIKLSDELNNHNYSRLRTRCEGGVKKTIHKPTRSFERPRCNYCT